MAMHSEINGVGKPVNPYRPIELGKYSIGIGDRFAHQARAQLQACLLAAEAGVNVIPVWNKSNREHLIVGSSPESVRLAGETAVRQCQWDRGFHIDADHIRFETVDRFIGSSDFFTIDVADAIGQKAPDEEIARFVDSQINLQSVTLPTGEKFSLGADDLRRIAGKYLQAAKEAGKIARKIETLKGTGNFIAEVSMDETDSPQSPQELLVILVALANGNVPLQTIAPKFIGRFNKGVDYVGDVRQFEMQFRTDVAVIAWAKEHTDVAKNLKLSIHSGSDKFAIYPCIRRVLRETDAGVHVKTAGTTWLEEVIGLAEAGGDGLAIAKDIYSEAFEEREKLCAPYATVIDIDATKLPSAKEVGGWTSERFVRTLRHDQACQEYNPHFRQLLHVAYKVAASMGNRYLEMLEACEETISRNVTKNLYDRHIREIFFD